MQEGLIHVYTGEGKGKTTAAAGLALRARSRGLKVLFAQFMKEAPGGEVDLLEGVSAEVARFRGVLSPFFHPEVDRAALRREAQKALEALGPRLGEFDLVVLDEFVGLVSAGLLEKDEALGFLRAKPPETEVVLTGRGAPQWLLEEADYVTEMRAVKHPFARGMSAKKGIEF
ncbi:MAG: cob(I)yrinic acid a,c-diamide adenosyltransferase [Thermodesulfovibrionales bacterium]